MGTYWKILMSGSWSDFFGRGLFSDNKPPAGYWAGLVGAGPRDFGPSAAVLFGVIVFLWLQLLRDGVRFF